MSLIRKKDLEWLKRIRAATDSMSGMYAGIQCDHIPDAPSARLLKLGLILRNSPQNPVHKDRFVISNEGRLAAGDRP